MRILVVEDEHKIRTYIKRGLEEQGYAVYAVCSGQEALDWPEDAPYDLIVLDILLPEVDGLTVCRTLRQRGKRNPILMLTARAGIDDRVAGLDAGADDYLVKPFALKELLARLRALTRRKVDASKSSVLQIADLTLDTITHRVLRDGRNITLPPKEYAVLEFLLGEPERIFTRTQIAEHVWNYDVFNQSNVVDVHIRNLRRQIDAGFDLKLIHTVRGLGYRISTVNDEAL